MGRQAEHEVLSNPVLGLQLNIFVNLNNQRKQHLRTTCTPEKGPGGLRDNRPHLAGKMQAIGIGDVSPDQTLDTGYLFRSAHGTPMGRPRSLIPGEIGWGIPWLTDWEIPKSGHQIVHGDFRQAAEDKTMHEKIGAWYPSPNDLTPLGSFGYNKENIRRGSSGTSNVPDIALRPTMCPSQSGYSNPHSSDTSSV